MRENRPSSESRLQKETMGTTRSIFFWRAIAPGGRCQGLSFSTLYPSFVPEIGELLEIREKPSFSISDSALAEASVESLKQEPG